jgi:hypothetical protein
MIATWTNVTIKCDLEGTSTKLCYCSLCGHHLWRWIITPIDMLDSCDDSCLKSDVKESQETNLCIEYPWWSLWVDDVREVDKLTCVPYVTCVPLTHKINSKITRLSVEPRYKGLRGRIKHRKLPRLVIETPYWLIPVSLVFINAPSPSYRRESDTRRLQQSLTTCQGDA